MIDKMKYFTPVILILLFLISCQDIQRTPKPDNLIPEDKMVDVLTEIALLHGARSYNKSLMEEKGIDAYPYLMEKFKIDSVQLVRSNNYYAENYKQYKKIYDRVKLRLEVLLEEYDSLREVEERRQDSIRNLDTTDTLYQRTRVNDSLLQDTVIKNLPAPVWRNRNALFKRDTIR